MAIQRNVTQKVSIASSWFVVLNDISDSSTKIVVQPELFFDTWVKLGDKQKHFLLFPHTKTFSALDMRNPLRRYDDIRKRKPFSIKIRETTF